VWWKEGDPHIGAFLADVSGREPEVVIVDPDRGPRRRFQAGRPGEGGIHLLKDAPVGIVNAEMAGKGVQNRPERFLRRNVIKAGNLFGGERQTPQHEIIRGIHLDQFVVERPLLILPPPGHPGA